MNRNWIIIVCSVFYAIGNTNIVVHAADNANATQSSQTSTTTQAPTAAVKPNIIIKDSDVCKKCFCDLEYRQIDCSNKSMTTLFSNDEWETLKNGDIFFDIIKMNHNEITFIPVLPTYPVKSLYLSFNQISNISRAAFQNLAQLTVLDLSNNKLTSKYLKPHVFEGLYATDKYEPLNSLKTLNLASNEMHTLNSDVFEHLPNLETLMLCKNPFHVIDASTTVAIGSANSLKTLDLSYMELSNLPDDLFHSLSELDTLILSGNLFHNLPVALTLTKHLKKLVLDENPLSNFVKENIFKSLGELKYLSISYLPDVTKIGPWALSDLQNLTTLVAENNPHLRYIHKLAFTKNTTNPDIFDYPPLEKLFLQNNNLTTIERDWIVHWEKITQLDLRRNPWTCDCTNSWLIHSLMKQINNTTPQLTDEVTCASPLSWKSKSLIQLSDNNDELVCVSASESGSGSFIWLGLFLGILIGIPLTFVGLVVYRKGCFGLINPRNPIADRSLYNRANFADDFHI